MQIHCQRRVFKIPDETLNIDNGGCSEGGIQGHETHYLLACPSVTPAIEPMYKPIKENLKRLALPPWDGLDDNVKISLLLGSSLPPQLDKRKAMRDQWLLCTQNYCSLIALKLSSTLSPTSQHTGPN